MPAIAASDEQVRELAAQILARAKYAQWRDGGRLDTLQRLLAALNRLLDWLRNLADTQPILYAALMLLLFALAAGLFAHIYFTLRAALRQAPTPPQKPASSSGFLDAAAALARAGSFLEAARQVQLAVIELLLQHGVLVLARHDPNRTLRRRLHDAHLPAAERRELQRLLDQLELHWFRDRAADPQLFEDWRALHARLSTSLDAQP